MENPYRQLFYGMDINIPTKGGQVQEINFDNAASTPPLKSVMELVEEGCLWYGSLHSDNGFKSRFCTKLYEESKEIVAEFVNADYPNQTVIYVKNATEALNKLSYRLTDWIGDGFVLVSMMEHHSNYLPWLKYFGQSERVDSQGGKKEIQVIGPIEVDELGRLKLDSLEEKLKAGYGQIKYVAVTGASNVSGNVNPIYDIARLVHRYGAKIIVDGAQWVPHCPVDMNPPDPECRLDFMAFSAHKMYAPFGTGVLIGPKEVFEQGVPEYIGGGSARLVIDKAVWLTEVPSREEAGTPNLLGAITLAQAIKALNIIGMDQAEWWEQQLVQYMLPRMHEIAGITIYGNPNPCPERLGIITFNIEDIYHDVVAVSLANEYGISVRNGCFCAQPYVQHLLQISDEEMKFYIQSPNAPRPGMVRASLALFNTFEEIDRFLVALNDIVNRVEHYNNRYSELERKIYWR